MAGQDDELVELLQHESEELVGVCPSVPVRPGELLEELPRGVKDGARI